MKIRKIIFMLLLAAIVMVIPGPGELELLTGKSQDAFTIVVDAGHGGPDGGAEAADGTREAELNLAIAKAVETEGKKRGINIILTRETDDGLYAEENVEKKWRKLEDLKCRKTIMDQSKADLAITIHMNCFQTDTSVRGAQTFYPKTGNGEVLTISEELAEAIQKSLVEGLADGSNRMQMGRGEVFLLENPSLPIVLVECGFLSNSQDLNNLKQPQWQQKIAASILDGIQAYAEI